jgi:serpin B
LDHLLRVANRVWTQTGFPYATPFLETAEDDYAAAPAQLDFVSDSEGGRQSINQWVAQQTEQNIRELIPQGVLNRDTRLVITNAIYFLSDWAYQFDPERTSPAPFNVNANDQVQVPMMSLEEGFGYLELPHVQIAELPYAGDGMSMVVMLPKEADGHAHRLQ